MEPARHRSTTRNARGQSPNSSVMVQVRRENLVQSDH